MIVVGYFSDYQFASKNRTHMVLRCEDEGDEVT
jgi:hypothetical protein